MKLVVTGGAGFIGTNLLKALCTRYADAEIISLDIRQSVYCQAGVDYRICDVRDIKMLTQHLIGATKVFHLAALIGTHESFEDAYALFETNVQGTINVLELARTFNFEVFIAGMPGIWNNPYSISKDAAVRLAQTYYETYQLKVAVLRWFSVYGPYQYILRYHKAVPTFITNALQAKPLPVYGSGLQVADFIHIDDATWYAIEIMEQQKWGYIVQCANGSGYSVEELAQSIIALTNSTSGIVYVPMRVGEPAQAVVEADTSVLDDLFPDYQRRSLDAGLHATIQFYRDHPALD